MEYSYKIGLFKTVKNSAWMLIPFALALIATIPGKYAWVAMPLGYFLKNYYENKVKK